jgi:integrase
MSVRFKNGAWIVELYSPITKRKDYVRGSRSKTERAARKFERDQLARRETSRRAADEETCDSFAARWVQDFPRARNASTRAHYHERVQPFGQAFAGRALRSITRQEARAWAAANPSRVAGVRTMINDALEERLADFNPFAKLGLKQTRGRRDIVVLTPKELDELCAVALEVHPGEWGIEFAAMIQWAAYTCMRPGETFAARFSLLRSDVYDLRSQFNSRLRRETEPKHSSDGLIYVPSPARDAVLSKPRRLDDDLMFRTKRAKQFRQETLNRAWVPVRAAFVAKLPDTHHLRHRLEMDPHDQLDFYELRHMGASYMLNELDLEPWVIAEQLRHSDGGALVIQLYGHPDRRRAIDRIRRAYGDNVQPLHEVSGEDRGNATQETA